MLSGKEVPATAINAARPPQAPHPPTRRPRQTLLEWATSDRGLRYLLLAPTVLVLLAFTTYPFLYSLYASLYYFQFGRAVRFIGLDNYLHMLHDANLWHSLWITAVYVAAAVGLEFLVGLALALVLSHEMVGHQVWRAILIFPMMLSPVVVGVMWRLMLNSDASVVNYLFRLVGLPVQQWLARPGQALWAAILVDVWQFTPFMYLILLAGLQSLPMDPYEAAVIDGASPWQVFRYVTLPLLRPAILVALLTRTMDAFRIFDQIFVLTQGGPGNSTETVSLYLYKTAFKFSQLGYAAAALFLVLAVTTLVSRVYIRALTRTAA